MAERAWKRVERAVARILGGRRIPVPGRHGPGADPGDVALPGWYVEVRARRRADLFGWWRHAAADARQARMRPLLVVREPRRGGQLLAVLALETLAEVMAHGQPAPAARPDPPGQKPAAAPVDGGPTPPARRSSWLDQYGAGDAPGAGKGGL